MGDSYDTKMAKPKLRKAIAAEAARLLLRGTETDCRTARQRAARWLSRKKVDPEDLPTNEEVQAQQYLLAGLFQGRGQAAVSAADTCAGDYLPMAVDAANDPDTFAALRMLLERLESVAQAPLEHPESDVLYHSLQVFELGRAEFAYDEELLWACLLHDVGMGIDRRNPVPSALQFLRPLVTERTLFLIEHLVKASDYLVTGRITKSLRRSEHFEELVQLARFDRDGRVPGTPVATLDEALAYLWGLSSAWDDV